MASRDQISPFLSRIVAAKRAELALVQSKVPLSELEKGLVPSITGRFRSALLQNVGGNYSVIAEVKKASPSKGLLCQDFHPAEIAKGYRAAGARALSVLTDREFFQGSLDDLKLAKAASGLPVLRKDFTLEPYHVYEAAAAGADAVLLIVAILPPFELKQLLELSKALGLDALVEVHNSEELSIAKDAGAEIIGVNNRDLKTFEVSIQTSLQLVDDIPDQAVAISESGLKTADDLQRLRSAGFDAFLIGERFMTEKDPGAALASLLSQPVGRTGQ